MNNEIIKNTAFKISKANCLKRGIDDILIPAANQLTQNIRDEFINMILESKTDIYQISLIIKELK